jgi:predicted NUDIX family NTP pyrophosphohydrolase
MPKTSAGLLVYRTRDSPLEVFLVHPGGPLWKNKDAGAWTIPKGELAPGEEPLAAALREFREETSLTSSGPFVSLGLVRQAGGKIIHAFAAPADFDAAVIVSNTFSLEWPPRSGRIVEFPEVDRGEWFSLEAAAEKMNAGQVELLERLRTAIEKSAERHPL